MGSEQLVCPSCASRYSPDERFCPRCRMPLVFEGTEATRLSERHERARKVKPQLTEGELVRVVSAGNQAEGEFIQGLLLEEGVPSMLRRSAGFDVPDFLAAGPRDVMVPASGLTTAREVLLEAEILAPGGGSARVVSPGRLLLGMLAALVVAALVVWLATVLGR